MIFFSTIIHYAPKAIDAVNYCSHFVDSSCRVGRMAKGVLEGIGLIVYGSKQYFRNGICELIDPLQIPEGSTTSKVSSAVKEFHRKIAEGSIFSGTFYAASGAATLVQGLHVLEFIQLGAAFSAVALTGSICTILATLVDLFKQVDILLDVWSLLDDAEGFEKQVLEDLRTSLILGILTDFGYLFSVALVLCGAPVALPLAIGFIGGVFGIIKMIYDYNYIDLRTIMVNN